MSGGLVCELCLVGPTLRGRVQASVRVWGLGGPD